MSRVVLPARLGPSSAKTSPGSIPKLTPRRASTVRPRPSGARYVLETIGELGDESRHGYLIRAICTPFCRMLVKVEIMFADIGVSVPVMIWFAGSAVDALLWVPA